jgi:hypothetical protein
MMTSKFEFRTSVYYPSISLGGQTKNERPAGGAGKNERLDRESRGFVD